MRQSHVIAASLAVVLFATTGTARAQEGLYVFGYGGAQQLQDAESSASGAFVTGSGALGGSTASGEVLFDPGFELGGGIGYKRDQFRVELGGSYAQASVDAVYATGSSTGSISGADDIDADFDLFSATLDGFVDLPFSQGPVQPFVGLGVSYTPVEADSLGANLGGATLSATGLESDGLFSFRLHAGAAYRVNDKLSLQAGYRYALADDIQLSDSSGNSLDIAYGAHTFNVGLRFALGRDPFASKSEAAERAEHEKPRPAAFPSQSPYASPSVARGGGGAFATGEFGRQPPLVGSVPTGGPFAVQVAAVRDPNEAEAAWGDVHRRFARVLPNSRPVMIPANFPGQETWHQVWVTGYDQATAERICGVLRQSGQPCAVARL